MRYVLFALALFITFAPLPANAQSFFGPIIPAECKCESVQVEGGGTDTSPSAPAWGCVLQTVQNVIRVAIALGFALATLALMYAGFVWMTSGSNAERRNQGSHLLINVFIGIFTMLGAWLLVDFVMKELYREPTEFGPWNDILAGTGVSGESCLAVRKPNPITEGILTIPTSPSGGGGSGGSVADPVQGTRGCPTCVALGSGFSCKSNASCTIDPRVKERLVKLNDAFNGTWAVTEAYPPTYRHSNQCHYNGTCIDAGFRGSTTYTAQNIAAFAQAASSAGLRVVFETPDCKLRDAARQAGVRANCSSDSGYGHITGSHFSVYSN